jgi:hypothetical protein
MVAVELAERRLAAVRDWFAATAGPESVPRIELRPARFAAGDRTTSRVLVVPRRRLAQ